MKLSVQPRPVVTDSAGNVVDLSEMIMIERRGAVRLLLTYRDIVPEGAMVDGCSVESETIENHIMELTQEVLHRCDPKRVQNFYRELGRSLRCVTSEENAKVLVDGLYGRSGHE